MIKLGDRIKFELQKTLKPRGNNEGTIKLAPTKEASRVNFYIWRLGSLPEKLSQIEHKFTELSTRIQSDHSWRYWPTMFFFFQRPFKDLYFSTIHFARSKQDPNPFQIQAQPFVK